ncbi:Formyl-CoA:oxalate CoA-transferase [compost metagenome]
MGNSAQFDRFCAEVIERPDLLADERFSTNVRRTENREALVPELRKEIRSRTRGVLLERLSSVGIPCGEALGLYDALTSPRVERSGLVTRQPHPTVGHTDVMAPPCRLAALPLRWRAPSSTPAAAAVG